MPAGQAWLSCKQADFIYSSRSIHHFLNFVNNLELFLKNKKEHLKNIKNILVFFKY
jgi:hypothetical protein